MDKDPFFRKAIKSEKNKNEQVHAKTRDLTTTPVVHYREGETLTTPSRSQLENALKTTKKQQRRDYDSLASHARPGQACPWQIATRLATD